MAYTFSTRTIFLLGKFLTHFQSSLDEVGSLFSDPTKLESIQADKLLALVFRVIVSVGEAETDAIKLLSAATRMSISEIESMDGYTFIKEFRAFLLSIDWKRLLGESLGLTLDQALQNEPDQ